MAEYIVRLLSPSVIRLGTKPYDDEGSRKSLYLGLPSGQIAIIDSLTQVSPEVSVRNGLLLQVKLAATNIDDAIRIATNVGGYALSLLSCVTMASADTPIPLWAYDATEGVEDREFRYCFYEGTGPRATRALNDQNLIHLLEKNYDSFVANPDIKDDFKERVQRSLMAFRRGLADNEDVLNEFLTAWSTMEGLDCVYTKLLPAASVRKFKDGMKDVLKRLGRPDVFDLLEGLRNDIAHGSLSLAQATQTAVDHVELIRQALVMMILRILKADEAVIKQIIDQAAYKGKARPHSRLMATIRFDPVDVQDFANQPLVRVWLEGQRFTKKDQTLDYKPDIRFEPQNFRGFSAIGMEGWGDAAAPIRMHAMGVAVIPRVAEEEQAVPTQAEWERVAYHEAGHAVVMMDLWGEPRPIVFRCANRNGILKAEGTFQLPMSLQAPEADDPNPSRKRAIHLVMGSAAGQVAELMRFGNTSDGVAGDNAKIEIISKFATQDLELQEEKNDGYPRTREVLVREASAWNKVAESCLNAIHAGPLPAGEFPNRVILTAETLGKIYARYRSTLSPDEIVEAQKRAYDAALKRGGGKEPPYDREEVLSDFLAAAGQVTSERPAI